MAQTAYDNGFGAAAQNNNFYGQPTGQQQQKMAQSSYGKGFAGAQQKPEMKAYQQKAPGSGQSRQPHPDISIKKSGSSNTSSSNPGYPNQQMYNMSQLTNEQKMLLMQMQKKGVPQSTTGAAKKTTGIQLGAAKKSSSGLGGGGKF